jgi:hydroxylaminobenzene mutase
MADNQRADQDPGHLLLRLGVLLFLVGLLTGFVIPFLATPRLGLSSHLEGLMNGLFLMVLGLMWPRLVLGPMAQRITVWLAVYGAFANWFATLLSAATGAGAMMPIAAANRTGSALTETVVGFLLISLSLAMVAVCCLLLWGLRRGGRRPPDVAGDRTGP